ncbi:LytR C-terminal domain-containing protein [Janthinobacterium sp.]|uniref:LytR C-terminal domain-containing protein n=1 Tax=Janthinobacterium sp. TaxID=1871054 RepID=UPI00293D4CA9|nr:LytR C-terminal domain-containing protein [Janthinobacterium sp.]
MRHTVHHLILAGAGALLLGCAGGRPQPTAAPVAQPAQRSADGYAALGRKLQEDGRDAEAGRAYAAARGLEPGHVGARNGLAVLAAARGDYAVALALWRDLTAGAAAAPRNAFLFGNLGYAYFLSGDNARALAALEQACVLDPLNALGWEHLGAVLEKMGQEERAALMFRQARSLRQHDAGRDYALLRRAAAAPSSPPPSPTPQGAADSAPAPRVRSEIIAAGGILQLRRVAGAGPAAPPPPSLPSLPPVSPVSGGAPPLSLEIRNGNGVAGMAAALARTLASEQLRVVRLGNEATFTVARSRVAYRPRQAGAARVLATRLGPLVEIDAAACKVADLCVILGRDLLDPAALHRYYVQQLRLARIELARLD